MNRHAKDIGCIFVSVEYRLAPQHKFPASFEDCVDGAKWCIDHAESLGARNGPIVVMGKSAGGSLTFAVALKLIDEGRGNDLLGIAPCQPITVHPDAVPADLRSRYAAYEENAENTVNTSKVMHLFLGKCNTIPEIKSQSESNTAPIDLYGAPKTDPYIFPLLHSKLQALPRVYMNACGADVLRDDARLMKASLDRNR